MTRRLLTLAAIVSLMALVPGAGFTQDVDPNWTPPRTPWGDPDLQGRFTNQSENGTPLERPARFDGLSLDQIDQSVVRELKVEAEADTIERFDGPLHAPSGWWQPDLDTADGHQLWLVIDPADGRIPPLTSAAEDRIERQAEARRQSGRGPADSWTDRSLYDRCITRGLPGSMMPAIYGNSYRIVQGPGFVGIMYEMIHEARIIPIVDGPGAGHVGDDIRQYMGDAFGYWDGDTLVVETRNFRDGATYRNANADSLRIVERFRRVAPDRIQWAVTMDDPETWTRPWTYTMPLSVDTSFETPEYSCHEGNYGLMNILSAARAQEAAAEADANAN